MTHDQQQRLQANALLARENARKELACYRVRARGLLAHWRHPVALLERVAATEGDRRLGPGLSADDYDFGEVVEIVNAARDLQAKIAECERDLRDMGTTNT